jgi:hypothetical protein
MHPHNQVIHVNQCKSTQDSNKNPLPSFNAIAMALQVYTMGCEHAAMLTRAFARPPGTPLPSTLAAGCDYHCELQPNPNGIQISSGGQRLSFALVVKDPLGEIKGHIIHSAANRYPYGHAVAKMAEHLLHGKLHHISVRPWDPMPPPNPLEPYQIQLGWQPIRLTLWFIGHTLERPNIRTEISNLGENKHPTLNADIRGVIRSIIPNSQAAATASSVLYRYANGSNTAMELEYPSTPAAAGTGIRAVAAG